MVVFDSAALYVVNAVTIQDKITRVDKIIDALMTTALIAAAKDNVTEYMLDDGQTKIQTMYRSASEVLSSIKSFEAIKQMYINQLNGRVVRLVDEKNFRRYGYFGR